MYDGEKVVQKNKAEKEIEFINLFHYICGDR